MLKQLLIGGTSFGEVLFNFGYRRTLQKKSLNPTENSVRKCLKELMFDTFWLIAFLC